MVQKIATLPDILSLLPQISRHDLALVRAAVDRLLGAADTATPLYDALLTVTGVKMPFSRFQRSKAGKHFAEGEKLVLNFVNDTWADLGTVTSQSLLVYLLEMLADDLKRRGITPSVGTLALNLSSVPQVFDNNYPGYRDDEMAPMILEAMVRK
jgi:hypothetical protein